MKVVHDVEVYVDVDARRLHLVVLVYCPQQRVHLLLYELGLDDQSPHSTRAELSRLFDRLLRTTLPCERVEGQV